ncbi:MAG: serpin family protein [Firmicutes bacterium]|nr:serpin family protein [Bacillota bacterium]
MKRYMIWLMLAVMLASIMGCNTIEENVGLGTRVVAEAVYPEGRDWDAEVSPEFLENLEKFSSQTAAELLAQGEGNSLYSPISLFYALAMCGEGANGATRDEFVSFLGMDCVENFAEECGNLYRRLYWREGESVLQIANSLWLQEDGGFVSSYQRTMKDHFYTSLFNVDFDDAATGQAMGQWVSENTGGKLKYEYNPNPNQFLSILNTVWIKDGWKGEFSKSGEDTFTLADGKQITADFMYRSEESKVWMGDGWMRGELSLGETGKAFFILPAEGVTVEDLLSNQRVFDEALRGGTAKNGLVNWSVPKVSMDCSLELGEYVAGKLATACSRGADFSKMTETDVYVGNVTQKTHIEWDEQGLEAAAYTEIAVATKTSLIPSEQNMIEMDLDRPFIFGVRSLDGVDLFIGVCQNPTA